MTIDIDCMECIAHAAETGDPRDVEYGVIVWGITHYAMKCQQPYWFRLCDYNVDSGTLRPGREPLPYRDVLRLENLMEINCMACIVSGMPVNGYSIRDGITHGTMTKSGRGKTLCRTSTEVPGPTPDEMMKYGRSVLRLEGPRSHTIQAWVEAVAEDAKAQIDWRLIGGWALVFTLGKVTELHRVRAALVERIDDLVDAYMACPNNFSKNPRREDVTWMRCGDDLE